MDYIGKKCPVCQKYFHADDDIVVCPECGTPHHRECYEQTGHCFNENMHAQGYDYQAENDDAADENVRICPSCGKNNDKDSFFCKNCGAALTENKSQTNQQQNPAGGASAPFTGQNGQPNGMPFGAAAFMDPLAGVPGDTDFGDGVTAGEAAKYVKQNTPYFIRVFNNIRNFNKSKFNFSAAIFTGGYMLYRKMYKLGALFAGLQLLMLIVESYITIAYSSLFTNFMEVYANSMSTQDMVSNFIQFMQQCSFAEILVLYLPTLIEIARVVMMIVIGICFNRMYFKHCKKQIVKIKENSDGENPETVLQTKGGVNIALAISLLAAYIIIVYLPNILTNFL
ncbi:MAG: DUF2628 domain-containing protein [Ruminococcus sp.]|uniref:RING finger protein n=1 Tax=Ruminococcus sp. TaxID=41978 RepID=UPI0028734948|nr:RING finger protein [Ruminococcus sp.]MBQ3284085.1 DUF2628 domain-containing protein [Ruminococcus sp.]